MSDERAKKLQKLLENANTKLYFVHQELELKGKMLGSYAQILDLKNQELMLCQEELAKMRERNSELEAVVAKSVEEEL